jgi:hypothetical protein
MFHCSAHPGATQPTAGVEQRIKDFPSTEFELSN